MAVSAARVTVETTAVALNSVAAGGTTLRVKNGAAVVSLGDSGVTTTTGFDLAVSGELVVELESGEQLFAICATSSNVQVLRT